MTTLERISDYLQKGRSSKVKEAVQEALDEGVSARVIMDQGLLAGMREVAEKFKTDEVFVPQVLVAARAINAGLQVLKPYLMTDGGEEVGTVVIGTVRGDMHDIGKNIVRIMMESKGIRVVDLGVDVPPERFYDAAVEYGAHIVCCSALLTATMEEMRRVVEYFAEKDYRDKVVIMVGGAPVNKRFCEHIGADLYTEDAFDAAEAAYRLLTDKVRKK